MDPKTIQCYDEGAADYAADWEDEQAPPEDLRTVVREHFQMGRTVDVGCGSGRDTAWMQTLGLDVIGVDASAGLLAEARLRHPGVSFAPDTLPALDTLGSGCFANVLCETVIMHLPAHEIAAAVTRLVSLLAPDGVLYLTWRVSEADIDRRDVAGRLYTAFDASIAMDALAGLELLMNRCEDSASSGKRIQRVLAVRRTG